MVEDKDHQAEIGEEIKRLNDEFKPVCQFQLEDGTMCCQPALDQEDLRCEEHSPREFDPDWALHPGETLSEVIAGRWAEENNLEPTEICDIINGFKPITPELAKQLEELLGVSETFWNNLQRNYEKQLAKIEARNENSSQ